MRLLERRIVTWTLVALIALLVGNGEGGILLQDNFDDGDYAGWTPVAGWWTVENGKLRGTGWGGGIDAWIYAGDESWTDYVFEATVLLECGNGELVFRSTGHWQNEYRFELWRYDAPWYANCFHLCRYKDGKATILTGANIPSPVLITSPAYAKVEVIGSTIKLFINGEQIYEIEDSDPLLNGRIGLGVIWDCYGHFDDVMVTGNQGPIADAGLDQTVILGESCIFDVGGSYDPDGTIVFYDWDFGDGTLGSGQIITHEYASVGVYTATLTVTDNDGGNSHRYCDSDGSDSCRGYARLDRGCGSP